MTLIKTIHTEFVAEKYNQWRNACESPEHVTKQFYLNNNIELEMFLHIGKFIYPDFCVIEGMVFLNEFKPTKEDCVNRGVTCNSTWQESFNRVNLADYFSNSFNTSEDIFLATLEVIYKGWENSLKEAFPERQFVINTETNVEPIISFYECCPLHTSKGR